MSDKTWKTQELLNFCPNDLTDNADVYVKSIRNKIDRIMFLRNRFAIKEDMTLRRQSNRFLDTQIEVEIYVESIASNLHSLADVLAQIINEIVLKHLLPPNEHLSSEKVDINKVKTKLDNLTLEDSVKKIYISEIIYNINKLCDLQEFQYISGFVNTIKHRRLLNTTFKLKIEQGNLLDLGFKLDAFDYKGSHFDETSCRSIVIDHSEKLIDMIFDIGTSVNNYWRASHIQTSLTTATYL